MDISTLKKALPILSKHNIVSFIWGYQGIGKTQTLRQYANENDLGFVHLHLATQDVGDLVGLLVHRTDGTVGHARPEWLPTTGKGIIFLDELNRAHPDVIQAMFSFITSKTIHTHQLPPGWVIHCAGNYQSETFTVTDTSDAAWMSRFCHIELQPTDTEFLTYAESRGAETIVSFISENSNMLEAKIKQQELTVTPDRRAWLEMVAPLECEDMPDEMRYELYKGIVGLTATTSFLAHKAKGEKGIKLKDIVKDYSPKLRKLVKAATKDKETRFDILSAPLDELALRLEKDPNYLSPAGAENVKKFLADLPLELILKASKKLGTLKFAVKDVLLNDAEFNKKLAG